MPAPTAGWEDSIRLCLAQAPKVVGDDWSSLLSWTVETLTGSSPKQVPEEDIVRGWGILPAHRAYRSPAAHSSGNGQKARSTVNRSWSHVFQSQGVSRGAGKGSTTGLAPGPWWSKGNVLGMGGAGSLWAENGGRRRPEDARGRGQAGGGSW